MSKLATNYFYFKSYPKLRAYLGHVEKGNEDDYRTPLFDGRPRNEVLDEWQPILESKLKNWPSLLDFENHLREKVGPMSIMKPLKERLDDIEDYYESIHLDSSPISPEAIDRAFKNRWSKLHGLRLKSPETTWEKMKKSTSSGNPFMMKKSQQYEEYGLGEFINGKMVYSVGSWEPTAILGWRGQEGGLEDDDVKQRVIWMFPMTRSNQELRCFQPLIEGAQKLNLNPAWNGNDAVDARITALFDSKGKRDNIVCTDFTKFDQHFNSDMRSCARRMLELLGIPEDWLTSVYDPTFYIPLVCSLDLVHEGEHGMPSGFGGTNAAETLAHDCLQEESAMLHKQVLNPNSMSLGDDGILSYPGCVAKEIAEDYRKHGQDMNDDKQSESPDECDYLRRWYHTDYRINEICRGVYSTYRALGKLMGQERFYDPDLWGPEMVVMRSLSIIENVKWHPARDEFLEFCVKGDKYRLGLEIPGFFDRLEREYESNELAQSFKSYTAGDEVGINSWWVVNALKQMR